MKVFGPDASQRKVFEGSVRGMVQDVLEGGNCLLFTYGVTNAGKTFTFLGEKQSPSVVLSKLAAATLQRQFASFFTAQSNRSPGICDLSAPFHLHTHLCAGPESDSGLLPRSLAVIFNSISGHLYSRCDLKPQRCRDYSRLTPEQQVAESNSKKNLLKTIKEVVHTRQQNCM